jgi:hypothetical protein
MSRCQYDTGSRFGNRPACDREATGVHQYWNGSYGPFEIRLCDYHVKPTQARVYPSYLASLVKEV